MTNPIAGTYYQHRYGGIYIVEIPKVLSTVDKSEWVVYSHVYPFEAGVVWSRPHAEWTDGRFREIDTAELHVFLDKDRETFQNEITETKKLAKG